MRMSICEYLDWDSDFFQKRIARIIPTSVTAEEFAQSLGWAAANEVDCVYFLCESSAAATSRIAEDAGFHLVDVRITKERLITDSHVFQSAIDVRVASQGDIPALQRLAGTSHTDSRFYFDRQFPRERCAALFKVWIEKSVKGWADSVFVVGSEGKPVGYISCHLDSADVGRIGLIAVDSAARGQGVGRCLIERAMAWFEERSVSRVTVVTQGRNVVAQRLYERCGFSTQHLQLWYHGWAPFRTHDTSAIHVEGQHA